MNKLLPLGLLLLCGCEQVATPTQPTAQQTTSNSALAPTASVDSYMRGYAKYEQCLWGYGACAVAVDGEATERTSAAALRTPRVRLTLRQQRLDVQFLTPYDPAVKVITIRPGEEFFVGQPETDALGANAIKVKNGSYPLDAKMGEYGGVHFNVQLF